MSDVSAMMRRHVAMSPTNARNLWCRVEASNDEAQATRARTHMGIRRSFT